MSIKQFLLSIVRVRKFANFQAISPPATVISILLIGISFLTYFIGGLEIERFMRYSALAASICAILIFLIHLINPSLARWSASFFTSGLVFLLAWLWQEPFLLALLVIPVILSAIMVNLFAVVLTAAIQTMLFFITLPGVSLSRSEQLVLILLVWLAALTTGGGYCLIERVLSHISAEHDRIQDLLKQSRDQQQKLALALEDLEHANRQLSLLYDKNISLRKTAEEATEAKSTYIARVSHEIRTPLNMILGITESVIENQESYEDELPLDLVDDIKVIRRNSEHLLSLVNDVLDLTRAETSRLILRKEWLDLAPEIEKSIEIVQPLAKKKKLHLSFDQPQPLPDLFCDRTRIRQVILNLLSNAVRYTNSGEIKIITTVDENSAVIEVKDTGPGIDTDDAERIFEPFYRGIASAKQETVGTGLGLSVCRQLVELHGGKIWLESGPKGSSFFFKLPLSLNSDPALSPVRFINERWVWVERKRGRAYNFITPEKKRVVVLSTSELLNGNAGLLNNQAELVKVNSIPELVKSIETAPAHLVIVNVEQLEDLLPQMNLAVEQIKDTPVIGSVFSSLHEKVRQAGAIDYLQKPFSNQRLRSAVEQVTPYPQRILVVDDNVEVQRLIVRILSTNNETTQYLLADNGKDALDVAHRKLPDLILLDLALPEMDGWEFIKCLKGDHKLQNVPVILVSAHDLNETPARSKAVTLMNGEGISLEEFQSLVLGAVR
ncbi:MAG: response regulator [Anaerolineaceae bacterium]|nr:response regulator [Anaerolineaceae bacterium]